ncbi:MAG: hypothetical protein FWD43_03500, partial [Coriobacteriia bacterium]|nr:hypothetical protein [Coriobacteriia bacterium]
QHTHSTCHSPDRPRIEPGVTQKGTSLRDLCQQVVAIHTASSPENTRTQPTIRLIDPGSSPG